MQPGQIVVSRSPARLVTVLGSCVAVCVWDLRSGAGGMSHYLLPASPGVAVASPRYGDVAVPALIDEMLAVGSRRHDLEAKLFGGACLVEGLSGNVAHLGALNVDVARAALRAAGVLVGAEDVGGHRGRRVQFETGAGAAWVRLL